jgi:hypothetical protein
MNLGGGLGMDRDLVLAIGLDLGGGTGYEGNVQ